MSDRLDRQKALAAIRRLAAEEDGFVVERNARRGMERLDHDVEDAMNFLEQLADDECFRDEPATYYPGKQMYYFIMCPVDEVDLYAKVALAFDGTGPAILVSYKPDGSPE